MKKRLSALLLAMLLVSGLAACGGDASSDEPAQAPSYTTEQPDSSSTPEPEPEPLNQAYLTGLEKGADYPEGKRITAVMVNNIAGSRPTRGLSEAKVVYEIKVEGGITRFMALYEDYEAMPTVGGVRSARDQFFQILLSSWGFYIHDGPGAATHPVNELMRNYVYGEFDLQPNTGSTFRLDRPGMSYEYTEYTSGEYIANAVANTSASDARTYTSTMFSFHSYLEAPRTPEGGSADEVAVVHSASYRSLFTYDSASRLYRMSQFNSYIGGMQDTIDENNGEQLAFTNVAVLFAPMQLYPSPNPDGLVKVDYTQGGAGYLFTGGGYELVLWRKGAPQDPLLLYSWADDGTMVQLNPGTTYIAVVDDANLPDFDANLKAGTGAATAASGEVNTGEVDIED